MRTQCAKQVLRGAGSEIWLVEKRRYTLFGSDLEVPLVHHVKSPDTAERLMELGCRMGKSRDEWHERTCAQRGNDASLR
jgi:hypothetical protein